MIPRAATGGAPVIVPVILLIGPTGAGKSSFIRSLLSNPRAIKVEKGYKPCTTECTAYDVEVDFGANLRKRFILIDTPGFVDNPADNLITLDIIAKALQKLERPVSGALYFHRITDRRLTGTTREILSIFKSICGEKFYSHTAYVTTMWDQVHQGKHTDFEAINQNLGTSHMRTPDGTPVFKRMRDDAESCRAVLQRFWDLARVGGSPPLHLMNEYNGSAKGKARRTSAGREILKKTGTGGPKICVIM